MNRLLKGPFISVGRHILLARRCQAATVSVELALITPILLLLILGIVDYGRATFDKMELLSAVRSGAQLALADTTLNTSHIQNAVVAATNHALSTSDVTTTQFCECSDTTSVSCGGSCGVGSVRYFLTITASQSFDAIYLSTPLTLSESVTIRTQ